MQGIMVQTRGRSIKIQRKSGRKLILVSENDIQVGEDNLRYPKKVAKSAAFLNALA
jgi:glutamate 5-kinase